MTTARSLAPCLLLAMLLSFVGLAGFPQSQPAATPLPDTATTLVVGDVLSANQVNIIAEPGLYGLGRKVAGSEYAVALGHLIRIDPATLKVLSILRPQSEVLD